MKQRDSRPHSHFLPLSVDSSPGSKVDSRLKIWLTRLQMEKEEQERELEREFQLRRGLEIKKIGGLTSIKNAAIGNSK